MRHLKIGPHYDNKERNPRMLLSVFTDVLGVSLYEHPLKCPHFSGPCLVSCPHLAIKAFYRGGPVWHEDYLVCKYKEKEEELGILPRTINTIGRIDDIQVRLDMDAQLRVEMED